MNIAHKIAKNTGVILAGQLISLVLNLVVIVHLARYLGEVKFGVFSFAIVFISYFAIIADFGMKPIIVREISRNRDIASKILGTSIIIKFLFSFVAVLLAYVIAKRLGYSQDIIILIGIISFTIFISSKLQTFRVVFESIFEADLSMEFPILFRMIDAIILLGLMALLIHLNCSLTQITLFYVLSAALGFFLTISLSVKHLKPNFNINVQMVKLLLVESFPLALYVALTRLYMNADVFFLKMLKGDAAVGYYSAAFRLIYPLNFIPTAIVMSLFPLMSKYFQDSNEKLIKSFDFGLKTLILIGLALNIGTSILHERLIIFLYTDKYLSSSLPLMILMWAELFVFLNFFLVAVNTSINKQKYSTYAAVWMLLINLVLNLLLIPKWGVIGASLARLITAALGFSILLPYAFLQIGGSLLPIVKKILPIAICFAIWLLFIQKLHLILIIVISPIIFTFLIIIFKVFSEIERSAFREVFVRTKIWS